MNIQPKSLDTNLGELLEEVKRGKMQLPDFQRNWRWDDNRIVGILASLSQGYPMGAIMRLHYGNPEIKFKFRKIEGVEDQSEIEPDYLVLDGQQRLTSIFMASFSKLPVKTRTEKHKEIERFYYFDIMKCLDGDEREEAIVSIPADRKLKANFDRDILLDLSTRELEYKNHMFPVNLIFDSFEREDWTDGYKDYHNNTQEIKEICKSFRKAIVETITSYKLPVITLDKNTPREAVCKVFENVNTGGVPLTVFELVTAIFATYTFDLRSDWEKSKELIHGKNETLMTDLMNSVDETSYLTTITLYTSYKNHLAKGAAISCKKKDVLDLPYEEYKADKAAVLDGYKMARKFLLGQHIFRQRDLPYTTHIIPLAAICAHIGDSQFNKPKTKEILSKWFWSGVFGEMYGGANETKFATDIEDVIDEINGKPSKARTISSASFSATGLLSLQSRQSAAYKGIMALLYKDKCLDFMTGEPMDVVKSYEASPDIHHIFPQSYCEGQRYPKEKWNSIINKTPLFHATNRAIGGAAPSKYTKEILKKNNEICEDELARRIETHRMNYSLFSLDKFDDYFIDRAKQLLTLIEKAMGKAVADRGSVETQERYGASLE